MFSFTAFCFTFFSNFRGFYIDARAGDDLSIVVTISNDGDVSGTTTIDLLLDESIIDSKEVEIPAHDTLSGIFEIDLELESGVHVFSVDGISTDVTVKLYKTSGFPIEGPEINGAFGLELFIPIWASSARLANRSLDVFSKYVKFIFSIMSSGE